MIAFTFWTGLALGVICGGVASALSSKFLGFFNKNVKAVEMAVKPK